MYTKKYPIDSISYHLFQRYFKSKKNQWRKIVMEWIPKKKEFLYPKIKKIIQDNSLCKRINFCLWIESSQKLIYHSIDYSEFEKLKAETKLNQNLGKVVYFTITLHRYHYSLCSYFTLEFIGPLGTPYCWNTHQFYFSMLTVLLDKNSIILAILVKFRFFLNRYFRLICESGHMRHHNFFRGAW